MLRPTRQLFCIAFALVAVTGTVQAQSTETNLSARAPRFLLASATSRAPVLAGPSTTPVLLERISIDLANATLGEALETIARKSGLVLMYSNTVAPLERRVRLRAQDITVAAALTEVLLDTQVDVMFTTPGQAVLVARPAPPPPPRRPGGLLGRVVSTGAQDTMPQGVVGAEVVVEGTSLRAITNEYGIFRFAEAPAGTRSILVSSIGYKRSTTEVEIEEDKIASVVIALEISPTSLAELVVTATGRQRRVELGNDITVIRADSIMAREPITSVTELLEGRVPGLVVQRTSGTPGDPARLRLRGTNSALLSNDPIVIVDGIRIYSEQSDARGGNLAGVLEGATPTTGNGTAANYATPSPIDYIDPHTIERIEVVKGPSAATLYGQDAANGVIVITTKKGQDGPARWHISSEYGTTSIPGEYPELFARWGTLLTSNQRVLCPVNHRSSTTNAGGTCEPGELTRFQLLNDPELTVLDRGHSAGVTVGVSGGSSALTYNVTGSYRDELGLIRLPQYEIDRFRTERGEEPPEWMKRPQNYERWGIASRITAKVRENADVSLSASLTRTEQQRSSLERELGNLMSTYLDQETGNYFVMNSTGSSISSADGTIENFFERAMTTATQFTNGVNVTWRPFTWFTTTADAGLNVVQRDDEILLPSGGFGQGALGNGRLGTGQGTSLVRSVNFGGRARVPLGRGFQFQLATGLNYTGRSVHDVMTDVRGLAEGTESINGAADVLRIGETEVSQATFGWYIEPGINHRRFWLSTGLRLDGGSSFGSRLKLPTFPKLSVSYLISDEPFFPDALESVFNTLRLRLAYGHAGRQPGPVDRLRLYGATISETVDGRTVQSVLLDRLGNTRLKPERSREIEGGFDADLFDDRVSIGVTAYRKTTDDAILDVPVAPSVYGAGETILMNIGVVRNEGVELQLGMRPVRTGLVTWGADITFSRNRNVVVELGPGVEPFYTSQTAGSGLLVTSGTRVAAGYPLFGRWVRPVLGYADANGNGTLDTGEVLLGDTLVYAGGTLPDYTATLRTTLSLFNGRVAVSAGVLYEDGLTQRNEVAKRLSRFSEAWNDPANTSLAAQLPVFDGSEYTWTQTVNTLRFNSLAVQYNLPSGIAQRVGARAMSIALQGTNLGLRTNYSGIDPNVNVHSGGNNVIDTGVMPEPRTWQIRINANY